MFAEEVPGLGLVVTMTTRFDPQKIRRRLAYWIETAVNQLADQAREQINSSGIYYPDEDPNTRNKMRIKAIEKGMSNLEWVVKRPTKEEQNKVMSEIKMYGMMVGRMALSYVLPWVGLFITVMEFAFGKKKKPYPMPWVDLYSQALGPAKAQTNYEELERLMKEGIRIEQEKQTEITRVSRAGSMFKLPEGVTSISRGALVISPVAIRPPSKVNVIIPMKVVPKDAGRYK